MTKESVRSFEELAQITVLAGGEPEELVGNADDLVATADGAVVTEPVGTGPFIAPEDEEEVTGEVEDPGEADEVEDKSRIVEAILAYEAYTDSSVIKTQSELLMKVSADELEAMLDSIQAEWEIKDGSLVGKTIHERVDNSLAAAKSAAINSQVLKQNVANLRKSHSEYHKLATRVEKALGTETVIKGMGHTEYHNMLEELMQQNHTLMAGIRQCLNAFVSNDLDDNEILIEDVNPTTVENNLRTLLSVSISSRQWLERSKKVLSTVMDLQAKLQQSEISNKALRETLENREQADREERKRQEEARNRGFESRYVLATRAGMVLGVAEEITPQTRIRIDNVVMVREMNHAFIFGSHEKAMRTLDKLKEWEGRGKKSKRLLEEGDVYPDLLHVYNVTLVKRHA